MPVLHVITGLNDGGAEAVLFRLCTFGEPRQHHVVSLMDEGKYGALLRTAGVRVTCLGMPRGGVTASALWQLYRLIARERPEIVQTWMYHADLLGGVAARLAGCRNVHWGIRHADLLPGTTGRSTLGVARACALLSRFVPRRIVACAERAREVHIAMGYDAGKFAVIPNGYDVDRFSPDTVARAAVRHEFGIEPDQPLLGIVGRWNPQKDHANLLAAFATLAREWKGARLLIVGTDCTPENTELARLIEEHELAGRVMLSGRRDDIPAVMNALDVHVLSSYTEAFPNVVAEAMACGTPCVVTDVGDAALIVGDTGWVVPPRASQALARAMHTALSELTNAVKWQDRQQAARQRVVDEFSLETMVTRYREFWASG